MKNKILTIVLVVIFLIGLSLLLYPIISNYINEMNQKVEIQKYNEEIIDMGEEKYLNLLKEAQQYNKDLATNYDEMVEQKQRYDKILSINKTDIMGYIEIEKIKVKVPIYHGTEEKVLQVGIGHMQQSSLPVGGESTHAVLFGHSGLPTAKLFSDLDKLEVGDIFAINILKNKLDYEIDKIIVVTPEEVLENVEIEQGKDYITLVTCTPYGINTHRLLIRGKRIERKEENADLQNNIQEENVEIPIWLIFAASLTIIIILVIIIIIHKK